jgi:hypothetical protein
MKTNKIRKLFRKAGVVESRQYPRHFNLSHRMIGTSLVIGLVFNGILSIEAVAQLSNDAVTANDFCERTLQGEPFARTELFFGLSKSNGSVITEKQFQRFLDQKVTPRFPDGLTVLSGQGQFQNSSGTIDKEGSKLLILLYPFSLAKSRAIEEIRRDYKKIFQQESVLRVDKQSCTSFEEIASFTNHEFCNIGGLGASPPGEGLTPATPYDYIVAAGTELKTTRSGGA